MKSALILATVIAAVAVGACTKAAEDLLKPSPNNLLHWKADAYEPKGESDGDGGADGGAAD